MDWDIYQTDEVVDTGSRLANLKELRPRQTMIRILFVFDPWRSAILLVGGDKTGQWNAWYEQAIPHAESLYEIYLKERAEEETGK
ncbi:type II toxin-antitoxin system RelE/ParE family toxin [Nocardia wallacei]|uniref:type II toxin-antitoxin system RelE/ParE family toxin n=1 Tax=Nocardia wallacei TaxID=480035 RepID=UPI002454B6F1|nr:type II toxin-antitoxin system RelE/ParE family toxin [Nocardia wallacei]